MIDNYYFIECLSNRSSLLSEELHSKYLRLRQSIMKKEFIIFSDIKSALQAI